MVSQQFVLLGDSPKVSEKTHPTRHIKVSIILLVITTILIVTIGILVFLYLKTKKDINARSQNPEHICPCGAFDVPAKSQASTDKIRGVNIGGFLMIEPNLSPSLFYQFMGLEKPPVDMRHFCSHLGSKEANKQLKKFWEDWVTRDDIKFLSETGITAIRVPVGYWMFQVVPDQPYKDCTDGSMEQLKRLIGLASEFGLGVIIDLHGAKNSQNGFDNSGWARKIVWNEDLPGTYDKIADAPWITSKASVDETIEQLATLAKCFTCDPTVIGVSLLNEPSAQNASDIQNFFTNAYRKVKQIAPHWKIHASDFQDGELSGFWIEDEFSDGAIDTHIYQVFDPGLLEASFDVHLKLACQHGDTLKKLEKVTASMIVGEWSLATDDCAMWLLGLNRIPTYRDPSLETPLSCNITKCAESKGHPSPRPGIDGPDGNGNCPFDADIDGAFLQSFALRQLHSYEEATSGWFYWNFKTEFGGRWSWIDSVKNGWLPNNVSDLDNNIDVIMACDDISEEEEE